MPGRSSTEATKAINPVDCTCIQSFQFHQFDEHDVSPQVGSPSPKVTTINSEIQKRYSFICDLVDINQFARHVMSLKLNVSQTATLLLCVQQFIYLKLNKSYMWLRAVIFWYILSSRSRSIPRLLSLIITNLEDHFCSCRGKKSAPKAG